ncbi:hypothetical protein PRNP1_007412 [Phytophthora ramorum]
MEACFHGHVETTDLAQYTAAWSSDTPKSKWRSQVVALKKTHTYVLPASSVGSWEGGDEAGERKLRLVEAAAPMSNEHPSRRHVNPRRSEVEARWAQRKGSESLVPLQKTRRLAFASSRCADSTKERKGSHASARGEGTSSSRALSHRVVRMSSGG